jgi:competence protein ComEA
MLFNLLFKVIQIFLASIFGLMVLHGQASAAVEVNSADQAALESVRGLGPSKAQAILAERKKNGPFKDSNDLHTRVKGIGEKTVERLMKNGLTVNSKALAPDAKPKSNKQDAKKSSGPDGAKESKRSSKKSPKESDGDGSTQTKSKSNKSKEAKESK